MKKAAQKLLVITTTDSIGQRDRPADEIEITEEMVEASAKYLADLFDQPLDWLTEERARTVFEKMVAERGLLVR